MSIEATIMVSIDHRSGPEITDEKHVIAWLCADGAWMDGACNGFLFEVCPKHSDPDECDPAEGDTVAVYAASIVAADLDG